ncbi:hypothetical protein GCM10020295_13900 [Streptomyces cinereospinus]
MFRLRSHGFGGAACATRSAAAMTPEVIDPPARAGHRGPTGCRTGALRPGTRPPDPDPGPGPGPAHLGRPERARGLGLDRDLDLDFDFDLDGG